VPETPEELYERVRDSLCMHAVVAALEE